jgi:hypothetical protein
MVKVSVAELSWSSAAVHLMLMLSPALQAMPEAGSHTGANMPLVLSTAWMLRLGECIRDGLKILLKTSGVFDLNKV